MSKTKTKRARRELKRDASKKIAAHHRKTAKEAKGATSTTPAATTTAKKQKTTLKTTDTSTAPSKPTPAPRQASQKAPIPFTPYAPTLLIGEGDFSFAHTLVTHHGCASVTATSFDDEATVLEKYPSFAARRADLLALTPPVPLLHAIDARKLATYKALRGGGEDGDGDGWEIIAFMFPHTGGLSTDVNRQVRANQALLADFFGACLSSSHGVPFLKPGGRVLVALFEGQPYELWGIRNLARHKGLRVVESYAFEWEDYPGYEHVRTLGSLEGGGAWRGSERRARMFVFEKEGGEEGKAKGKKKRKKGAESESDSEGGE